MALQEESNRQSCDPASEIKLKQLKTILLNEDRKNIENINTQLSQSKFFIEKIAKYLPNAITERYKQDQHITKSLLPNIAEDVKTEVLKDKQTLVDLISPAMGPIIRRSVQLSLSAFVDSMNVIVQNTFSLKGLSWRLKALVSNKSFAEIALLNSFIYRVEHIFLIDLKTSIPISHLSAEGAISQDPSLVSGMLSAIQDFVADSFNTDDQNGLSQFTVGEKTVFVSVGSHAVLAAVLEGRAPADYPGKLAETLDLIHSQYLDVLKSFQGQERHGEVLEESLNECLTFAMLPKSNKISPILYILPMVMFAIVGWFYFNWYQKKNIWENYVYELQNTPGLVVSSVSRKNGKWLLRGMKDKFAVNPLTLFKENSYISQEDFIAVWNNFISLDPIIAQTRARQLLNPPESIKISFLNGDLKLVGEAENSWIKKSALISRTIPGVSSLNLDQVTNLDMQRLEKLSTILNSLYMKDLPNTSICLGLNCDVQHAREEVFLSNDEIGMKLSTKNVVQMMQEMNILTKELDLSFAMNVQGYSNKNMASAKNKQSSSAFANSIHQLITKNGFIHHAFSSIGMGNEIGKESSFHFSKLGVNQFVKFEFTTY